MIEVDITDGLTIEVDDGNTVREIVMETGITVELALEGPQGPHGGSVEGSAIWGEIVGTLANQADLQANLNLKVPITRTINSKPLTGNIVLNKTDIGLGNVDNTSDADKPVSDDAQLIIDGLDGNGVVSGCQLSINADPTKFNISAGVVHKIGNGNLPYPGQIGNSLTYLSTHNVSYIALDQSGDVIQSSAPFLMADRRVYIIIGVIVHSNRTTINAVNNLPDVTLSGQSQFNDLLDSLQAFNKTGNLFYANGANLFINKTAGDIFKKGVNFNTDINNPHVKTLPLLTAPANIRYRLSNGTEYADTQEISKFYESPIGTRTAIPVNRFSIQRISIFSSNLVRIQYGQAIYNSLSLAQQGLLTEQYITESNISENGLLRAYLIIKGSVTSLQNTDDALFIYPDRFGQIPIGSGGGTTDLQQAYNNSSLPSIITNAIGPVQIQAGVSNSDSVFEILNLLGSAFVALLGDSIKFGNIEGNNYLQTLSDGFQQLIGTSYWVDIDFPIIIRTTGPNIPTIATIQGNLTAPQWAVNDFAVCEGQELVHGWREASPVFFHIHIYTSATHTENRYLKFEVEYTWANFENALPANAVITSAELLIPANTADRTHLIFSIGSFTPTGGKVGGHVKARLKRVVSTGLAAANPFCEMLQLHITCDTLGSRAMTSKGV